MKRKFPFIFVPGTKVPRSKSSQERKFPGTKVLRSECSLLGTFIPQSESTEERKGHVSLRNVRNTDMTRDRSRERQKLPRTSHKHNASVFIDISIKYKLAYINTIVLTSQKVFTYIGAPALSTAHLPRPFAAMFLPFPENTECCAAFRGKYHSVTSRVTVRHIVSRR